MCCTLAFAACGAVDSIIAALTGLDQSKYAEYESSTEEHSPVAFEVSSCTIHYRRCTVTHGSTPLESKVHLQTASPVRERLSLANAADV